MDPLKWGFVHFGVPRLDAQLPPPKWGGWGWGSPFGTTIPTFDGIRAI